MLQRFLLFWLVLASVLAYFWPDIPPLISPADEPAEPNGPLGGFDPFVDSKPLLMWLIAAAMLAIGSLLPRDEIRHVARRWPTVIGGTAVQYLTMPLLAYAIGNVMQLDRDTLTGLIVVGCVPGAMASNVLTLAARGNVSYSVSLTTSATLFSPIMVPMVMSFALGGVRELDQWGIFQTLLLTVVGPVVLGHLLSRRFDVVQRTMSQAGPVIANLVILWIIAVVVGLNRARLAEAAPTLVFALALLNVLGYIAGYFGAKAMRLREPMRRALTLEVGMQNAGLGTALVLDQFQDSPAAAIPTAAYTFGCMLSGTVLAQFWSRRGQSEDIPPQSLAAPTSQ